MAIKDLQAYLESQCAGACLSVDLLKISKSYVPKRRGRGPVSGRFCLVVDADSCLDRLYGGFYSDWVCGGQWNRMLTYLSNLLQACQTANMELVVFFNGALESQKMDSWYAEQLNQKKKVNMVLRHIHSRGTPPPKVWWNPPVFLHGALRLALRQLGVGIAMSMDDHAQEVIGFCREHGLQGILGQNPVYVIFDPPRYFSSQNLKLTYKGSLETKEYVMDEIAKTLDLNPNRFCLFAALLGNHILTEENLYEFFKELVTKASQDGGKPVKPTPENVIRCVVDYVRSIPDVSNLDTVAEPIFRNSKGNKQELAAKLKQSVQYYMNGTEDGFLRYKPRAYGSLPHHVMQNKRTDQTGYADPQAQNGATRKSPETSNWPTQKQGKSKGKDLEIELPPVSPEIMRIASERHQKGVMSPWVYQLLSQGEVKMVVTLEDEMNRELPTSIDLYKTVRQNIYSILLNLNKLKIIHDNQKEKDVVFDEKVVLDHSPTSGITVTDLMESDTGLTSPNLVMEALDEADAFFPDSDEQSDQKFRKRPSQPVKKIYWSKEEEEEEINKLFKSFFDTKTWPKPSHCVKAIRIIDATGAAPKLFEVPIKEWVVRRSSNQKPSFDLVIAKPVEWKTPSIERMWLGQQPDDKSRRLRAFLTIMHSDTPLMLNTNYVPQHLLILCSILRYMLYFGRILQRQELDAFLAMSVSPLLHDVQTMQDLKLPSVQPRGVALAGLFMAGVETATFANDVCGAPIPWNMVGPWQFFDGKLFHFKLLKANNNTPLIDMCDGQVEQVLRVERLRQAIMENLQFEFAKPFLPAAMYPSYPMGPYHGPPFPPSFRPAGMRGMPDHPSGRGMGPMGFMGPGGPGGPGRGRGILGQAPVDVRGGQLEIAGVVVGSWGANVPPSSRGRGMNNLSPKVMSVGGPRRGGGRGMMYRGMNRPPGMPPRPMMNPRAMRGGRGMPMPFYRMPERAYYSRPPRAVVRGVRRPKAKPKSTPKKKAPKGRGVTVDTSASVKQKSEEETEEVEDGEADDDGDSTPANFEDAEEGSSPKETPKLPNGVQSPDSGIHDEKSSVSA